MRTDIHRPSAPEFDPEQYEYRGSFDLRPECVDFYSRPARVAAVNACIGEGFSFHNSAHGMGQCGHCGANIRYAALMVHPSSRGMIWVGETCLSNRFELCKGDFQKLRKAARLNRERATKAEKIETLVSSMCPELRGAFDWAKSESAHYIASDIARRIEYYAEPASEAQEELLMKLYDEHLKREAEKSERASRVAAGKVEPCPSGRVQITGTILATRIEETQFGNTVKMLVEDVRGFRLWGSRPVSLCQALKGDIVSFIATVEPKHGDPVFGFFSRPSKGQIQEAA